MGTNLCRQGIGEFTDIQATPAMTSITFADRKTAEKFFYGLSNKEIPGIEGKVELAWVSTPLPPVKVSKTEAGGGEPIAKRQPEQPEQLEGPEQHAEEDRRPVMASNEQNAEQADMDYDVADDNDWA
jgi:RNA-binding protein 26